MAKSKARKNTTKKNLSRTISKVRRGRTNQRVTTLKPNGDLPDSVAVPTEAEPDVPISEAMRTAVAELGPVTIDATLAPDQLRQLSDAYEDVTRRKFVYQAKAEEAKVAKKSLESSTEMLLELVRSFTHSTPLPLFDTAQAQADLDAMVVDGGNDSGPGDDEEASV